MTALASEMEGIGGREGDISVDHCFAARSHEGFGCLALLPVIANEELEKVTRVKDVISSHEPFDSRWVHAQAGIACLESGTRDAAAQGVLKVTAPRQPRVSCSSSAKSVG